MYTQLVTTYRASHKPSERVRTRVGTIMFLRVYSGCANRLIVYAGPYGFIYVLLQRRRQSDCFGRAFFSPRPNPRRRSTHNIRIVIMFIICQRVLLHFSTHIIIV